MTEQLKAIPVPPYVGDEEACRQAGFEWWNATCTCNLQSSYDKHKKDCPKLMGVLAARKAWIDKHVLAWSCCGEANGKERCEMWCIYPDVCPAAGTDRRVGGDRGGSDA